MFLEGQAVWFTPSAPRAGFTKNSLPITSQGPSNPALQTDRELLAEKVFQMKSSGGRQDK